MARRPAALTAKSTENLRLTATSADRNASTNLERLPRDHLCSDFHKQSAFWSFQALSNAILFVAIGQKLTSGELQKGPYSPSFDFTLCRVFVVNVLKIWTAYSVLMFAICCSFPRMNSETPFYSSLLTSKTCRTLSELVSLRNSLVWQNFEAERWVGADHLFFCALQLQQHSSRSFCSQLWVRCSGTFCEMERRALRSQTRASQLEICLWSGA